MRTLGMIEQPISEDFLLNFALFETHVLCMTLSAAFKSMEVITNSNFSPSL
jgi:hypothetical protein